MERTFLPIISMYVHRKRLDELLHFGLDHRLLTVVAGPGYGKTLALSGYFRHAECRLIWLRMKKSDNDPSRFWQSFLMAAKYEMPQLVMGLERLEFPLTAARQDTFRQLYARQATPGARVVFLVDDYENLQDATVRDFFEGITRAPLPNTTLVLSSNEKMPFAAIDAGKGHFRITEADLAFNEEETRALFEQHGLDTSDEEIHRARYETGGWPMALQLMCAERRAGISPSSAQLYIRLAAELFEQHFYGGCNKTIREMLVGLSLLPTFPLRLVTVLAGEMADEALEMLALNPFISFDHLTELFVFQKMYRDYLARKQALLREETVEQVYMEAGHWFLEKRWVFEAMDCFWAVQAYDAFIKALEALPPKRIPVDTAQRILRRLEDIPPVYRRTHPAADLYRGMLYLNNMRLDKAQKLLRELVEKLGGRPHLGEHRQVLGEAYLCLAMISGYQNRAAGLELIRKAVPFLEDGSRLYNKGIFVVGNSTPFFLPGNEAGTLERMVELFDGLPTASDRIMNGCGYGFEHAYAAYAAYYRGELQTAEERCYRAIQKAQLADQHDILCNTWWLLVRIHLYYGQYAKAAQQMEALSEYISERQLVELYDLRDDAMAWYCLKMGDATCAGRVFKKELPPFGQQPWDTGRDWLLRALYLFEVGEETRALALLAQLDLLFDQVGLWHVRVVARLLRARCFVAAGEEASGVAEFKVAYDMAYGNDLKLVLAEYGRPLLRVIDAALRLCPADFDAGWLQAVRGEAASYAKRLHKLRQTYQNANRPARQAEEGRLTARETETLYYMAQGLTQEEVGRMMGVSVNAVKKHVAKIYTKLGAVNRADAIHIAATQGLLPSR